MGFTMFVEPGAPDSSCVAYVTAQAEAVHLRVWHDGVEVLERRFLAARRGEVDLLAEAIEAGRREDIATGSLRAAAELAGGPIPPAGARPKA